MFLIPLSYIELICSADWFLSWHSNQIESHYYDSQKTFLARKQAESELEMKKLHHFVKKVICFNASKRTKKLFSNDWPKNLLSSFQKVVDSFQPFLLSIIAMCFTFIGPDHLAQMMLHLLEQEPISTKRQKKAPSHSNHFFVRHKNCCFFALNPPHPINLPSPFPNYPFLLMAII